MFQIVLDQRKRREIDPTLRLLRELAEEADASKSGAVVKERVEAMLGFFETMSQWYSQIRALPQGAMIKFVKMGSKVRKMLTSKAG